MQTVDHGTYITLIAGNNKELINPDKVRCRSVCIPDGTPNDWTEVDELTIITESKKLQAITYLQTVLGRKPD